MHVDDVDRYRNKFVFLQDEKSSAQTSYCQKFVSISHGGSRPRTTTTAVRW